MLCIGLLLALITAQPQITEIRLERTPCFGSCPVDEVILRPDGSATYIGKRFVKRIGRYWQWSSNPGPPGSPQHNQGLTGRTVLLRRIL